MRLATLHLVGWFEADVRAGCELLLVLLVPGQEKEKSLERAASDLSHLTYFTWRHRYTYNPERV